MAKTLTKTVKSKTKEIKEPKKTKVVKATIEEAEPLTSIAPIEETKPEPVAKEKKTSKASEPKPYSDRVFTIMSDDVIFLSGDVQMGKGQTVQRVTETKLRIQGLEVDGKTPFSEDYEFGEKASLFEKQLEQYESGLGIPTLNKSTQPSEPVANNFSNTIIAPPSKVEYSTTDTGAMEESAVTLYDAIMNTPSVKYHNKNIPSGNIEAMLKTQSQLYSYRLNRTAFGQFYIDMSQGNKVIRIPKDTNLFLPVI